MTSVTNLGEYRKSKEFKPRSAREMLGIPKETPAEPTDAPRGNVNVTVRGGTFVDRETGRPTDARHR